MTEYTCFKFRRIDDRLVDALIKSTVYFPRPAQLNDPFDCSVDIFRTIDHAINSGRCEFAELLRRFRSDVSAIERFRSQVAKMGVGSFSTTIEETLLWSHYANNHRGVALRYEFPVEMLRDDDENILGASLVSYDPNAISEWLIKNAHLYKQNHHDFIIGLLKKVLMSKAPSWSYEKEARIIRFESGPHEIPRSALTQVVFGLQASPEDEDRIRKIINKYYEKFKFGRAVRTANDFGIEFIEI